MESQRRECVKEGMSAASLLLRGCWWRKMTPWKWLHGSLVTGSSAFQSNGGLCGLYFMPLSPSNMLWEVQYHRWLFNHRCFRNFKCEAKRLWVFLTVFVNLVKKAQCGRLTVPAFLFPMLLLFFYLSNKLIISNKSYRIAVCLLDVFKMIFLTKTSQAVLWLIPEHNSTAPHLLQLELRVSKNI